MTQISGHLASAIKPPHSTDTSKVPILLIDRTKLHIATKLDYSNRPSQVSLDLSGIITLKLSVYATDDPPRVIRAAIGYNSGAWSFSTKATDVPMASLSSLFAEGPEREAPMQMLSQVHLAEIFIDYTYAGASVSKLKLGGSMTMAGVTASVEYNRSQKDTLQGLLRGNVAAILPDFVRNITLPDFELDHDHVQLTCSSRAFGVVLSIGKLHVQLGQLRQNSKDKDQEIVSIERLVIVLLSPLPSTADVPLVGSVSLPFDQLEFVWASEVIFKLEIDALEAAAGFSEDTTTRKRRSRDSAPLSRGFHFCLVGYNEVWIDHPFTRAKKPAPRPRAVGQGQIVAVAPKTPPAAAGPMVEKSLKVSISGINVAFDCAPVLIAGGVEHVQNKQGEMFAGDIAISLTQFSIGAVFVYAMVESTLFTVGWAEIRGLVAGFGYISMTSGQTSTPTWWHCEKTAGSPPASGRSGWPLA
ncbi:hypothetical protein NM208_g10753 [Fusarium decemcellulare]|uniref:Uncharacterized protein n=1 Tax=Fusarium decemcellulare TaxID=57161 RepID=A0ACC1RWQ4_9HYPO|nr:hypothetical protein NM208_g10753 [Fusarium decemcellulare]